MVSLDQWFPCCGSHIDGINNAAILNSFVITSCQATHIPIISRGFSDLEYRSHTIFILLMIRIVVHFLLTVWRWQQNLIMLYWLVIRINEWWICSVKCSVHSVDRSWTHWIVAMHNVWTILYIHSVIWLLIISFNNLALPMPTSFLLNLVPYHLTSHSFWLRPHLLIIRVGWWLLNWLFELLFLVCN